MNPELFWQVIENYNKNTFIIQIILFVVLVLMISLSYCNLINWLAKLSLSIVNFFIGITHFIIFGQMTIQYFFAAPLYLIVGGLFLFECIKNPKDKLHKPNAIQIILLLLFLLYPLISFLLGNRFPHLVTHIMPCPVISLSIVVYSCYTKKNLPLLIFITIWGLTGIKAFIANAYEDVILLVCGLYGVYLVIKEIYLRIQSRGGKQ